MLTILIVLWQLRECLKFKYYSSDINLFFLVSCLPLFS